MSQLVTGEAIALDLRTAALPSRMLAALVDGVLQGLVFFVLFFVLTFSASNEAQIAALSIGAYVLSGLGYPVLLETLMKGRTPGKAVMGLRVVRDDAGPIAFRQAFVRGLVGFIVERPGFTLYAAGVVCGLVREDGKRVGDVVAGTVVIQERIATTPVAPIHMPGPLAGWATTLDLSRLSDDLALSARSFLNRSNQLTDVARAQLGGQLVAAVSAVVTPPPPPDAPDWAYLSAVLAERRRRAEAALAPGPSTVAAPAPAAPSPPPPPPSGGFAAPF